MYGEFPIFKIFVLEIIWLPKFKLDLSDKQWMLLSKCATEMMCSDETSPDLFPGTIQYQRPNIVIVIENDQKFKKFLNHTLTVLGRELFTYEMVEKTQAFVRLRTIYQ